MKMSKRKDTILVIDDQPTTLIMLFDYLKQYDVTVVVSETSESGLKRAAYVLPDLILLDVNMPGYDGFETCRRLKKDACTRAIPVLFLTAHDTVEEKVKGFEAGGVDYITKPLQLDEVWARIQTHLTISRLQHKVLEKNDALHKEIEERKQIEEKLTVTLREKEVLMKEILHRTKNNMSSIVSLLTLQAHNIKDDQMKGMIKELQNRINSMMLVQQKLYQSHDFSNLDLKEYLIDLSRTIFTNLCIDRNVIALVFDMNATIFVASNTAVTCGLLFNELFTNALKYAFPGKRQGEIRVMLSFNNKDEIEFRIRDNGVGIPDDFDINNTKSLGLQLVMEFVYKLYGSIELNREAGTEWVIRFKNK